MQFFAESAYVRSWVREVQYIYVHVCNYGQNGQPLFIYIVCVHILINTSIFKMIFTFKGRLLLLWPLWTFNDHFQEGFPGFPLLEFEGVDLSDHYLI